MNILRSAAQKMQSVLCRTAEKHITYSNIYIPTTKSIAYSVLSFAYCRDNVCVWLRLVYSGVRIFILGLILGLIIFPNTTFVFF